MRNIYEVLNVHNKVDAANRYNRHQGQTIEYEYNYLNTSGEFPAPVTTDFFNICEREKS